MRTPFLSFAIASRILCASTKAALCWTPRSRRQREGALAFNLVAEDGDGSEIVALWWANKALLVGEKPLAAGFAVESGQPAGPAAFPAPGVRIRPPANLAGDPPRPGLFRAHHLSPADAVGSRRQQKR